MKFVFFVLAEYIVVMMDILKCSIIFGCVLFCTCTSLPQFRFPVHRANCTRCRSSFKLGLAEKRRIEILKQQIIARLGFTKKLPGGSVSYDKSTTVSKAKTTRESESPVVDPQKQGKAIHQKSNYTVETAEIVSFSDEKSGKVT